MSREAPIRVGNISRTRFRVYGFDAIPEVIEELNAQKQPNETYFATALAQPNEAVIAVFLAGGKLPLAMASKRTAGNRREKIDDIPSVADQLELEFRVGPAEPGTIVFNGPENAPERAVSVVTISE